MKIIDLSGMWRYKTDEDAAYEYRGERFPENRFKLPGTACENHIGKRRQYYDKISAEAVRAPRERYEYIAPLWLQRDIDIPDEADGKSVKLFLERVNIASELWIDDIKIGRQIIELSAPHVHNLTGKITSGKHTLTLKIDNRNLVNIDFMASGYSVDTQGYWNGIVGRIELRYEEIYHIDNIQIYPDDAGINVKVTETCGVHSPFVHKDAFLELEATAPNGARGPARRYQVKLYNSKQVDYIRYDMEDIQYWDEFHPDLYKLTVKYICDGNDDEKTVRFGMRTIKSDSKRMLLNGKTLSLRGTTDCAIFPLTGYPNMDIDFWRERFRIVKSYGLNHVRFHAWCPPECAFCAADEAGGYVSAEMPMWLNRDVCALELGDDAAHRQYFLREAITISKTYGNHPSFIMFSNGNENMGDFELLNDITTCVKAYDRRRLYTLTTNFDHPVMPCEDYLCAYEAGGRRVRIQCFHDEIGEGTYLDYSAAVSDVNVPIVSFEIGQYCVYPNVNLIDSYTGNMLPVNLDAIKKHMLDRGVYDKLNNYIKASGDLAVKLYKEDIEAALRTKGFGGFELLSLCDYTGQSTATIGILDVFCRSKGLIEPDKFRQFCGVVVPLFKSKRIFTNDENLEAELDLYDFGENKIANPKFIVSIYNGDELFYEYATRDNKISAPLNGITKSAKLDVTVSVGEYKNSWRVFVFAPDGGGEYARYIRTRGDLERICADGGRAVVTRECFDNPIQGSFIPVFWSPVHFPSQKPCGAMIDDKHPVFDDFPTDKYPDYQWKKLLDNAVGMDISEFDGVADAIVETVPNFFDNTCASPLFEVKIGNAELLFCGFDLNGDYPEARQLKYSIEKYISRK